MKFLLLPSILIFFTGILLAADTADWPDRRPIGTIFLATSGKNWPKNPRGYFNDPDLDVSTEAGKAELRRRMMDLADRTIARVNEVGAQGVVVWDIEGGEMPHAVTYLGDPRILSRVAPEMDAIADEFFARFREAGVPTGICIRPSTIVFADEGNYPWIKGRYGHTDGPDPVGVLSEKIAYARKRWGCTNFYVDTNYTPKLENGEMVRKKGGQPDFRMLSSAEMAELRKRHPDVLIWPEFQEPDYFSSVSGYAEYHQVGRFSEVQREKYPNAFRVWMPRLLPEDIYAAWEDFITQGMMKGEVFLFECAPSMSPMGEVLKNARSEAALRRENPGFQPAGDAQGLLAQLQTEKDWARRRVLVEALGSHPSSEVSTALAGLLTENNGLQWFAARALAHQETPEAFQILRNAARTGGSEQIPAIIGLGSSGGAEAVDVLLPLLTVPDKPEVRWAALDALGTLGKPEAAPALLETLKSLEGTPAMRSKEKVIRALGRVNDPAAVPVLLETLKKPEYARLRPVILKSLANLGAPQK